MSESPDTLTPTEPRQSRLLMIPGGRPNLDQLAYDAEALALRTGRSLTARLQPDLYFNESPQKQLYRAWPGVIWKGEFASADELVRFREDLQTFIEDWFLRAGGSVVLTPAGDYVVTEAPVEEPTPENED